MYMGVVLFFFARKWFLGRPWANFARFLRDHRPVWILDSACFLFSCVTSWHIYNMCVCACACVCACVCVCVFTYIVYLYLCKDSRYRLDREREREKKRECIYMCMICVCTYMQYIYRFAKMFFLVWLINRTVIPCVPLLIVPLKPWLT